MLEELTLWNVGGVSRCHIPLKSGLTVITGESGTGKSSIVRAIELIAGKRASSSMVRGGEEEAGAEAIFSTDVRFPELDDNVNPSEKALFAKRTISTGGRGRAMLQGNQLPLGSYTQAVSRLLHIQSQFAQMELLDTEKQLDMVDSCGGAEIAQLLSSLQSVFDRARQYEREYRSLSDRRAEIEKKYTNANEVIPLVRKVRPEPGLEAALEAQISELKRQKAQKDKARQSLDRLTGGLSEQGLLDDLKNITESLLLILPDEERAEAAEMLRDSIHAVSGFADDVQRSVSINSDEVQEMDRLEARMGALRRLKRMTSASSEEELLAYCTEAEAELGWLEESYGQLEAASDKAKELRREASQLAISIRQSRRAAADILERGVNLLLGDLGMGDITFSINLNELPKLRRNGADEAEFTLSTDKRSGRVEKIASGGELSRLLLALQLALPDEWLPPTLVFDEVEAGLGGKAAVLSGMKLKELSRKCQVILVTHEASIAALGDSHIVVRREGGESYAETVSGEGRKREIARMLSGSPDLEEALDHAERLLEG